MVEWNLVNLGATCRCEPFKTRSNIKVSFTEEINDVMSWIIRDLVGPIAPLFNLVS